MPRRAALAFILTTVGVLLLALAALDWTAHDFPAFETLYLEHHRHRIHGDSFNDPWQPDYWWDVLERKLSWLALAVASTLAAITAPYLAARRPRTAAALITAATVGAAAIAALAVAAITSSRADDLARATLARPSGPRLRWLTPDLFDDLQLFFPRFEPSLAAMLLLMFLVPAIAWSWASIVRRATAVAAAVLATLAVVAIAFLRIHNFDEVITYKHWLGIVHAFRYVLLGAAILTALALLPHALRHGRSRLRPALVLALLALLAFPAELPLRGEDYGSTEALPGWQDTLDVLRLVLIGAAGLCTLILLPDAIRRPSRLLPALALALLGAAAFAATAPHRHANRTFYPILDVGFEALHFHWLRDPETLDPPRVHACAARGVPSQFVALRLDHTGAVVLDLPTARYHLPAEADIAELALGNYDDTGYRREDDPDHEVILLVDRRVPATAVTGLLRILPPETDLVSIAGAFTQTLPSAAGPIETWTLWRFATLRCEALLPPPSDGARWGSPEVTGPHGVTADMTWGDIVDYPTDRYLQRDEPLPPRQIPEPEPALTVER